MSLGQREGGGQLVVGGQLPGAVREAKLQLAKLAGPAIEHQRVACVGAVEA